MAATAARHPRRGRFITVEGAEGVGKSTNIAFAQRLLEARGVDVVATREPGGTCLAEEVRQLLLAPRSEAVDAVAETLLVFAARAQHLAVRVEPALAAGSWVLCDRFTDSTFAYQGGGRGVSEGLLAQLAEQVHGGRWPDLTLYLDAPFAVGAGRLADRPRDRIEQEGAAFFERVRAVFRQRARQLPRIALVDADRPLAAVQQDLARTIDAALAKWLP